MSPELQSWLAPAAIIITLLIFAWKSGKSKASNAGGGCGNGCGCHKPAAKPPGLE